MKIRSYDLYTEHGQEKFEELWPDGLEATTDNLQELERQGFDVLEILQYARATIQWEDKQGDVYHMKDGLFHRENGPAILRAHGMREWRLHGRYHREGGRPAIYNVKHDLSVMSRIPYKQGINIAYYEHGRLHKKSGPANIVHSSLGIHWYWYRHGRLLREEHYSKEYQLHHDRGPAIWTISGLRVYWRDGQLHNDYGPALISKRGIYYYVRGQLHRTDGPAVILSDGTKKYFTHGKEHTRKITADRLTGSLQKIFASCYPNGLTLSTENLSPENLHPLEKKGIDVHELIRQCNLTIDHEYCNGAVAKYVEGQLHCDDGPAVMWADGEQNWYRKDLLHRDDGPAIVRPDGSEDWYQDGWLHREDGPARIRANGMREWLIRGVHCREGAPAVTWIDGDPQWEADHPWHLTAELAKNLGFAKGIADYLAVVHPSGVTLTASSLSEICKYDLSVGMAIIKELKLTVDIITYDLIIRTWRGLLHNLTSYPAFVQGSNTYRWYVYGDLVKQEPDTRHGLCKPRPGYKI